MSNFSIFPRSVDDPSNTTGGGSIFDDFWGPRSANKSRGGAVFTGEDDDSEGGLTTNDASWVLTATFIIFTMQSGNKRIPITL